MKLNTIGHSIKPWSALERVDCTRMLSLVRMACRVLLATLAIPIPVSLSDTEKYMEVDEITRDKSKRLAGLLSLQNVPTRDSLITEMVRAVHFIIIL